MIHMFDVRSAPCPDPYICSVAPFPARCVRRAVACRLPPPGLQASSHRTACMPPFDSRQNTNSLSADNKLAIRCAWADTNAFGRAGYDSSWAPESCPFKFTSKDELMTAVAAFSTDADTAEATYGPIAGWDVSGITDMNDLFRGLEDFNADISNWDTSSVTTMGAMFGVRSAPYIYLQSGPALAARCVHRGRLLPAATMAMLTMAIHLLWLHLL